MKKLIIIVILMVSPTLVAPTLTPNLPEKLETTPKIKKIVKDYYAFLDAIGHQESGNRYNVVNRFGYMGRFQFGKSTLRTIKVKVDKETFLNNPQIQDYAMLKLLCYNKTKLQKYIDNFVEIENHEGDDLSGPSEFVKTIDKRKFEVINFFNYKEKSEHPTSSGLTIVRKK